MRPSARVILLSLLACLCLSAAGPAVADTLEDLRKRGTLLWGGDEEGGGPYVFPKEDEPGVIMGFEVDFADALAVQLGVKAKFAQGNWDKLPDLLRAKKFDFILNGYEDQPVRREVMETSVPYYVYALQLMVRKNDPSLTSFADLHRPGANGKKRKIGVLSGSAAEEYMRKECDKDCEVINYDGSTDAMREVENSKLDATLQDTPIASFYAPRFPALHGIGAPVAPGYYVVYARKGEANLIKAINDAIVGMYRNGEMERIYKRYGLWDAEQLKLKPLLDAWSPPPPEPASMAASGAAPSAPATEAAPLPDTGTLAALKAAGKLRWGADEEGGGPYIFPREDKPEEVIGFEVDLAEKLAEKLGVKSEYAQGNWDKLPDLLRARKFDVILNGYELQPVREDVMEASVPYFVYALQLMTRKDDASISSYADLHTPNAKGKKRKIGVLSGSAAEDYMRNECKKECDVVNYDGSTDAMREVETGKLDATMQDTPIASFYAPRFPKLHNVGDSVGHGYYVVYARKGDKATIGALNQAFAELLRSGELEKIYKKYGIWDANQAQLAGIVDKALGSAAPPPPPSVAPTVASAAGSGAVSAVSGASKKMEEVAEINTRKRLTGWAVVDAYWWDLTKAAGVTILLALTSFPIAILLGLLIAVGRVYGPLPLRIPLAMYVEFLRGTPLMLQLYFIFFMLPEVGINIEAFPAAIMGLAINYSAYESEIYRAGLQAIPPGQMEAAVSLGMSRTQAIRHIVVPQAVRIVIPPVVSDFIALFKDTSVCSVITVVELSKRYSVLSNSTQAIVEIMIMTSLLYLLMSYPLSVAARRLEVKLNAGRRTA